MPAPSDRSAGTKRSVLLIDEDPKIGHLVRSALGSAACLVLTSTRAEEGLRLAARHRPALILIESRFKSGDGIRLASKLLQAPTTSTAAVALLTGERALHRRLAALQSGAVDFIHKPIDDASLRGRVAEIFARIASGRGPRPVDGPSAQQLHDHIARIEREQQSVTLQLSRPGQTATLVFAHGRLESARLGQHSGLAAFDALARIGDWVLAGQSGAPPASDPFSPLPGLADGSSLPDEEHTILDPRPPAITTDIVAPVITEDRTDEDTVSPLVDEDTEADTDPEFRARAAPPSLPSSAVPARPAAEPIAKAPVPRVARAAPPTHERPVSPAVDPRPATIPPAPRDSRGDSTKPERPGKAPQPPNNSTPDALLVESLISLHGNRLVVAFGDVEVRKALVAEAEVEGFDPTAVATAVDAYQRTREQRPVALLVDTHLSDATGRELLAAIRSDFLVREEAFIIISSAELKTMLSAGRPRPMVPVFDGLRTALGPRARLWDRLQRINGPEGGWVEPIGVSNLLRMLGVVGFSGSLQLRHQEARNAELLFNQGQICGATVSAPESSVGPLALFNIVAYEWAHFLISPEEPGFQVPLGDLALLVESACCQNNLLMERIYHEGVNIEDVATDRATLDAYLRSLPASSLSPLMRVVEGTPAAALVADGANPSSIKGLLHDLRRKGVVRVQSLEPVRRDESPRSAAAGWQRTRRPRSLVIVLSTIATVALATGGYSIYRFLGQAQPVVDLADPTEGAIDGAGDEAAGATLDEAGETDGAGAAKSRIDELSAPSADGPAAVESSDLSEPAQR